MPGSPAATERINLESHLALGPCHCSLSVLIVAGVGVVGGLLLGVRECHTQREK